MRIDLSRRLIHAALWLWLDHLKCGRGWNLISMINSQFIAAIESISNLLSVIVWPAVLLYILQRFSSPLSDFFSNLSQFTLKVMGMEATVIRKHVEAAAVIGAAVAKRAVEAGQTENVVEEAKAAAGAVADLVTSRNLHRLGESTVLWVDDRPDNNLYERQALETLGVRFVLSISTDDALAKTQNRTFDAIISDMGRPPDPRAGYTLLDALRKSGDQTPFVIYAASREPRHVAESRRHGALGCTNRPQELIEMVLSALGRGSEPLSKSA